MPMALARSRVSDSAVQVDHFTLLEGNDGFLPGARSAAEDVGLGVAGLVLATHDHRAHAGDGHAVLLLHSMLDLHFVALAINNETIAALLFALGRHLFSDEGADEDAHGLLGEDGLQRGDR